MKNITLFLGFLVFSTTANAEPKLQCSDFKTQRAAQKFYEKMKASGDTGWKTLDRDGDGRACDCLPGGNGKNCPNTNKK